MSMVGSDKLNHAVLEQRMSKPSEILSSVNKAVKQALKQNEEGSTSRDGMDIALVRLSALANGEGQMLSYAAANRPLYIIRKNAKEVTEISATKSAIGGFTPDNFVYENHEMVLHEGDTFYIFTDGYADQFGGEKGKKLMTKRFKEILLSIQEKSMKVQEKILDETIEEWKKDQEQVDDILVIGVRV